MSQLKHDSMTGLLLHGETGKLVSVCPAPCECPDDDLPATVAIDVSLIEGCLSCSSAGCNSSQDWEGTFTQTIPCTWSAVNGESFGLGIGQCVLADGQSVTGSRIELDTNECRWVLVISCLIGGHTADLWRGIKTTGNTPVGEYTRSAGCMTRQTMEVF